jgi:hypothetical protein
VGKKRFISKKNLLKIALFLAVVATAVLFDLSHDRPEVQHSEKHNTKGSQSPEFCQFCFYSTFNSFKLKSFSNRLSARNLFLRTQSEFIQRHHNLKAGQLVKLELAKKYAVPDSKIILIRFQKSLYRYPDDAVPVS